MKNNKIQTLLTFILIHSDRQSWANAIRELFDAIRKESISVVNYQGYPEIEKHERKLFDEIKSGNPQALDTIDELRAIYHKAAVTEKSAYHNYYEMLHLLDDIHEAVSIAGFLHIVEKEKPASNSVIRIIEKF